MKKLLTLTLLLAAFTTVAEAGLFSHVSKKVKRSFREHFPAASHIKWYNISKNFVEAEFVENNKEVNAYFAKNGLLQEADVQIEWSDLPATARHYIVGNFTNCKIERLMKNEDVSSEAPYVVEIRANKNDSWLFFAENGDMIEFHQVKK